MNSQPFKKPKPIKLRRFSDDDEPRISSRDLAEMLRISHDEVLDLTRRNRDELLKYGPIVSTRIRDEPIQ
jgi:hypothetical protein